MIRQIALALAALALISCELVSEAGESVRGGSTASSEAEPDSGARGFVVVGKDGTLKTLRRRQGPRARPAG